MKVNLQKFIEKQMLPQKPLNEGEVMEDVLNELDLNEDDLNEDEEVSEAAEDKTMSEEDLKIESLKIATNIAKLMSDVTTDDIIEIADKVSGFIRDHQIGSNDSKEDTSSENSDVLDTLELPSESNSEENSEENKEENNSEE